MAECEHEFNDELWKTEKVGEDTYRRTCTQCGFTEEELLIIEYWKDKTITLRGKTYKALKGWGNIGLCSDCGKVVWSPIILWDEKDPSKAVLFHLKCARKLGLFTT